MPDIADNISAQRDRDMLLQAKYRGLVEKHLRKGTASRLLACGGAAVATRWVPLTPCSPVNRLPVGTEALCRLACRSRNGQSGAPACARRWHKSLQGEAKGSSCFTCRFGVRNFWVFLRVRKLPVGLVLARSLVTPLSACAEKNMNPLGASPKRLDRAMAHLPVMGRSDFACCMRLVELIVDDITEHVENDLQREELQRAILARESHEASETQLRKTLNRVLPYVHELAAAPDEDEHRNKMMHGVLQHIQRNFHRPLSLPEVAGTVRLSACHFSTIFSRHVGVSFRDYMKGVRLEKAQDLLQNPSIQIAEVAQSVGYTDPNSFRQAFKAQTGIAPSVWRETLRPAQRGGSQSASPPHDLCCTGFPGKSLIIE
jgi:AraC-like DNA-binding protein